MLTNYDLEKIVDTSNEWIETRTGIKERRIAQKETTAVLASNAAKGALLDAGLNANEIDLIVVATFTPNMLMPSVACQVQKEIGAKNAACFDISAACSGFLYGIHLIRAMIQSGIHQKALLIGSEVISKVLDWHDRNTCVLFGDGAGAVVLENSEEPGIIHSFIGSKGDEGDLLTLNINEGKKLEMKGKDVFKFATQIIPQSINRIVKESNINLNNIDYIIPHQANKRIVQSAAKKLSIENEKFYLNLMEYGNTSAASIPIALDEMNRKGLLDKGMKIIMVGFGGGLTYGASLIEWTKVYNY